jgi:hypothetical protein
MRPTSSCQILPTIQTQSPSAANRKTAEFRWVCQRSEPASRRAPGSIGVTVVMPALVPPIRDRPKRSPRRCGCLGSPRGSRCSLQRMCASRVVQLAIPAAARTQRGCSTPDHFFPMLLPGGRGSQATLAVRHMATAGEPYSNYSCRARRRKPFGGQLRGARRCVALVLQRQAVAASVVESQGACIGGRSWTDLVPFGSQRKSPYLDLLNAGRAVPAAVIDQHQSTAH